MCDKIGLFNFYFKVLIIHYYLLLYDERKNSAKYHKILMSRFWEIVFCVPILFCRHNCLSNLKTRAVKQVTADGPQNCVQPP